MKIEITERQAVVLALAVTNYTKQLDLYVQKSGSLLGADYNEEAQTYKAEAQTLLSIIAKADTENRAGTFANIQKEQHDLATEAFWYIKKQVDERGQIHTEARHAGAVLEWNDCHRFPFVGIGVRGETMMFNDDWQAHVADDSEIIEIAVKLQEGQGNV